MITLYSKNFKKSFKKLSKSLQNKVLERLEIFEQNEFASVLNNHKLHSPWEGDRSINVTGDTRLIYRIIEKDNARMFMEIGSHSKLYK